MSAPYNSVNSWFPMDWNTILADQWYQQAAMAPNVNFKAARTTEAESVAPQATNNIAIPVAPTTQEQSSGGPTTTVLGTALLAGGALWMLKSGKFSQARKALRSIVGKGEAGTTTVLKHMRAVKNRNGELQIQVPGKTTTVHGKNIQPLVDKYGITGAISAERQAFNPATSALESFKVKLGKNEYVIVHTQNGKITKVVDFTGQDTLKTLNDANATTEQKNLLEKINKIVTELGKDSKDVNKSLLKDVSYISYTNKFDDDILKLTMKEYGQNPSFRSFTTLEQFSRDSKAVKAYTPSSSEEVFAGELVNQKGSWLNKRGVLVDGLKVVKCEENIAGAKCYFEGGKLIKIEQNGEIYTNASIGFKEFEKANKEAIERFTKDVFEDRIASKIPTGAIIGTV